MILRLSLLKHVKNNIKFVIHYPDFRKLIEKHPSQMTSPSQEAFGIIVFFNVIRPVKSYSYRTGSKNLLVPIWG